MTSTNFVSGLNDVNKPSSKVLRPPGGGSSDIFGSEGAPATPRSVRNHMVSNIFGSTTDTVVKNSADSARRGQKSVDSYSRLFGEPERPFTPAKNHMKSSIPIGGAVASDKTDSSNSNNIPKATTNGSQVNGHEKNGKFENGDQQNNVTTKGDGNPVTGEGYKPAGAEINTTIPFLNGANQVINKNRIPPGGYSSGLW